MNIRPEELEARGFVEVERLEHKDLVPFVKKYLQERTAFSRFYYQTSLILFLIVLLLLTYDYVQQNSSVGTGLLHVAYGIGITFTLIPLHELLHALAYWYVGARQVSFDANWKKFYFMAMADQFVVNRREFQIVALVPFVVITTACLIALLLVPDLWRYTVLGVLLTHTVFCSGDFGLLSFFAYKKDAEVVTYDDKAAGLSYFYEK